MATLIAAVKVVHIITAVLMVWPFYALVVVNNRARLGPPLGDRADTYMESIIKNRTVPCFVFQATALVTGLALILLRGQGLGALVTNPVLGVKFLLLVFIAGILSFVHFRLQPALDRAFAAGGPVTGERAAEIQNLRRRRKRLASVCLFSVLTLVMLGVQVWAPFPPALTAVFLAAIAAFTWRAFETVTPYGWG